MSQLIGILFPNFDLVKGRWSNIQTCLPAGVTPRPLPALRERKALADIGKQWGKQAVAESASIVTPDTILAWCRKLVGQKFDGSRQRKALGRPKIDPELEASVVRMAQENRSWGYNTVKNMPGKLVVFSMWR